jgi:phage protein D
MTITRPSVYAPDFDVALGNRPVPAELRAAVTSVRFEEAFEGADRVELQLANAGLRFLDHPLLRLRTPLQLSLGYRPGQLGEVFTGTVTGMEPSFPSEGMPTMTISAQDDMQRLMQGTKQRGFPWYLTDTVIAGIVAAENGLLLDTDWVALALGGVGLLDERPRFQHRQSDHDFLRQLAAQYDIDIWVDGDRLHFRSLLRGQPRSDLALRWGASLIDFGPRLSSIGQIASVSFRLWVRRLELQIRVTVGFDGERLTTQIATGSSTGVSRSGQAGATLELPDHVLDNPAEAIRYGIGELRRRVNSRITATGTAIGDPALRVGKVISITGVGRQFSSDHYRLTSVAHSVDGNGYRTAFTVRQEVV